MRLLLVCLLVSCLIAAAVSESEPECPEKCDKSQCIPDLSCECGTHLGWCDCCEYCAKCPGDECITTIPKECAVGFKCVPYDPEGPKYGPGICEKEEKTS